LLFGLARPLRAAAIAASVLAGFSWTRVVEPQRVGAICMPEWVRGRGLALYLTVFFGTTTLGQPHLGGEVASVAGLPALTSWRPPRYAACVPLTCGETAKRPGIDLTPSIRGQCRSSSGTGKRSGSGDGDGRIPRQSPSREAFLTAVQRLSRQRAQGWRLRVESSKTSPSANRFLETVVVESWLEHLRSTNA